MEWYEETLNDKDSTYIEPFSDQNFTQGKMFKFRYDPVTRDKLSYFDQLSKVLIEGNFLALVLSLDNPWKAPTTFNVA